VCDYVTCCNIDAIEFKLSGCQEHLIGFTDTSGSAKENLEFSACLLGFLFLKPMEQFLWIGPTLIDRHKI
jgi:hypothetical protein